MLNTLAKKIAIDIVGTSKGKYILKNEKMNNCPIVAITIPFLVPNC
jgi:hypothetical protein